MRTGLTLLLLVAAARATAIDVEDYSGHTLHLDQPARRVIALTPQATELSFAAGAGRSLVGVSRFSGFPPAARELPVIGDATLLERERVLALAPDLAIAWASGSDRRALDWLASREIPVLRIETRRLDDIPATLRAIGALTGHAATAARNAAGLKQRIGRLRAQSRTRRPVRVFYQVWHRPLMTVSDAHIIADGVAACGGRNVFADAPGLTPSVSFEAVLAARPEVIVIAAPGGATELAMAPWSRWFAASGTQLPVVFVDPDTMHRGSGRMLDAVEQLCGALGPLAQSADQAAASRSGNPAAP